jgi:DNA modification methylase
LKPTELQKLFAAVLALAREYAAAGAAIYATVPSVFLKYFIQAFEDGGFSYRHCLVWIKQSFVLGRRIITISTDSLWLGRKRRRALFY